MQIAPQISKLRSSIAVNERPFGAPTPQRHRVFLTPPGPSVGYSLVFISNYKPNAYRERDGNKNSYHNPNSD